MKNLKTIFSKTLIVTLLFNFQLIAQQKKVVKHPSKSYATAQPKATTNKVPAKSSTTQSKPSSEANTISQSKAAPIQQAEQKSQTTKTQDFVNYRNEEVATPNFGRVIKLNFANLIIGGISLDYENRIASNRSVILSGGYYARGVLKGNYRVGTDFRQYLGESKAPKGIFVSLGAMANYFKYTNADTGENINLTFMNIRALFGYQAMSGNFTFEGAIGPGYGLILSKNIGAQDAKIPIGILPSAKLSIGYAF